MTTTAPSALGQTSHSTHGTPACSASQKAWYEFSGARCCSPRCATMIGVYGSPIALPSRRPLAPPLPPLAHGPADLLVHLLLLDALPLVVVLLAAGDAELDLGVGAFEVDGQRDQRRPP